jgi:hypothetical protein
VTYRSGIYIEDIRRLRVAKQYLTRERSLRSRRLVRAGEEKASFEETPAQMAMTNVFSPAKDD